MSKKVKRTRRKANRDDAQVMAVRTRTAFGNHSRRAKETGEVIEFALADLRGFVAARMPDGCAYCRRAWTAKNWSLDHRVPTCRTGRHALDNLVLCCLPCNTAKGPLDGYEWSVLLDAVRQFSPSVREHTLARLRAGASMIKGGATFRNRQAADERAGRAGDAEPGRPVPDPDRPRAAAARADPPRDAGLAAGDAGRGADPDGR